MVELLTPNPGLFLLKKILKKTKVIALEEFIIKRGFLENCEEPCQGVVLGIPVYVIVQK